MLYVNSKTAKGNRNGVVDSSTGLEKFYTEEELRNSSEKILGVGVVIVVMCTPEVLKSQFDKYILIGCANRLSLRSVAYKSVNICDKEYAGVFKNDIRMYINNMTLCKRYWVYSISAIDCENGIGIPNGVEAVRDGRFLFVSRAKFPKTLKAIIANCFYGCKLEKVIIDSDMDYIGECAFSTSEDLSKVRIRSVKYLGACAFMDCDTLKDLDIGTEVKFIGKSAFNGCIALIGVDLTSVTEVDGFAFDRCVSLKSVKFGKDLVRLGAGCFRGCESLTEIDLSMCEELKTLPKSCFSGCTNLKSIKLPKQLVKIDDYCFEDCSRLVDIDLGDSLLQVGDSAFANCVGLESMKLPEIVQK